MKPKTKIIVTKSVRIPDRLKGRVEKRLFRKTNVLTRTDPIAPIAEFIQNHYKTDPEQVARQGVIKRIREITRKR